MTFPKYKRARLDWDYLSAAMKSKGYHSTTLAKELGIPVGTLYKDKRDGKMNPALAEAIADSLGIDVEQLLPNKEVLRVRNGRSTTGRLSINRKAFELIMKDKHLSTKGLSRAIGRSDGYVGGCLRVGGFSEEIIRDIAEVLGYDPELLKKIIVVDEGERIKRLDLFMERD